MRSNTILKGVPDSIISNYLVSSLSRQSLLRELLKELVHEENLQLNQLVETFNQIKSEQLIPLSIFSTSLRPAESICKYLRENLGYSNKKVSVEINRDERSTWSSYQRAKSKMTRKFIDKKETYLLPISIFQDRSYSLMEGLVLYLSKTYELSNKEISKLLKKSQNSIAVVAKRAREKDSGLKNMNSRDK